MGRGPARLDAAHPEVPQSQCAVGQGPETGWWKLPFEQGRRCLIPASGFYEWHTEDEGRKAGKTRYYITSRSAAPLTFAGLWERNDKLNTDPNALMEPIHDRMPAILDPADWETWRGPRRRPDDCDWNYSLRGRSPYARRATISVFPPANLINLLDRSEALYKSSPELSYRDFVLIAGLVQGGVRNVIAESWLFLDRIIFHADYSGAAFIPACTNDRNVSNNYAVNLIFGD